MIGFQFNGIHSGIKKQKTLKDLGIIYSEQPASAAAVFTTNKVVAAPVLLCRDRIKSGICQAVLVNSGNANCCTGIKGMQDAVRSSRLLAEALNIPDEFIMVASTGVIGAPLPMDAVEASLKPLVAGLNENGGKAFAESILTTDLVIKSATRKARAGSRSYTVTGFAKGSGMIKPDMATMLAFVVTDLSVSSSVLQPVLTRACGRSFNRISVDGDTSTNDMVLALANGMSDARVEDSKDIEVFQSAMDQVLYELAEKIVKDGEGAEKLVKITVKGAASADDALKAAQTIADSSLVKTAISGEDPNWGRIIAAAGRSGAELVPALIDLFIGGVPLMQKGEWLGPEAEKRAAGVMKTDSFEITLVLHLGEYDDFYLFCDLTKAYIEINADYRS